MAWTGERMVPCQSDAATELYHWQRYLYFRPWYTDANVIDAASGEGYGTAYAATYAASAQGFDLSAEAIQHANVRYPNSHFSVQDVVSADYSGCDLILSFETIEHVPDPEALLRAFAACPGRIVISTPNRKTHSPGNRLEDKPLNPYHTVEWTPNEFAALVNEVFAGRQVRFLSQEQRWPGLITEGLDDDAMYCIAVIGDGELPQWPKVGISIPTVDNARQLNDTIVHLSRFYPGELQFCVVANGTSPESLAEIHKLANTLPYMVKVLPQEENLGYGIGANVGLEWLQQHAQCDLYVVSNDDVVGVPNTLIEMVLAHRALAESGQRVGALGPVSNNVSGAQKIEFEPFEDLAGLLYLAEQHHLQSHSSVSETYQLRGLFLMLTPECLQEVGGFDPRFNYGNFEDDDHNLRCKLAGFSLWIVDGAFLFHHGSQTFAKLTDGSEFLYKNTIERNQQVFQWKWDLMDPSQWPMLSEAPTGVDVFVPLNARWPHTFTVNVDGWKLDLATQASDIEFVQWVYERLRVRDRQIRGPLIDLLLQSAPHLAVVESVDAETPATSEVA